MTDMLDKLIQSLLRIPSISPNDGGCQTLLAQELTSLGFTIESKNFGDVRNLWARRGNQEKTFLFVGHTDVVPPGPLHEWKFPPFEPTIDNGQLYARGAADMKVAIACMVEACRLFFTQVPQPNFNIAFLITSCEEANTEDGTEKVIDQLINNEGMSFNWCLVGEPSSLSHLGDSIKVGRRGSLHGELTIIGKQGHIAYPHLAKNPIHLATTFLEELTHQVWDHGNEHFDPTTLQISNIHSGDGTTNVIPSILNIIFNFRYAPTSSTEYLRDTVETLLKKHRLEYKINWLDSAKPFQSHLDKLHTALQNAIIRTIGKPAKPSTSGGTSDARFIAPHRIETIEFGFSNNTIHQVNEHIDVADIKKLTEIYYLTLLGLHNLGKMAF